MAYPSEKVHMDYLAYVERYSLGEEGKGPKLSKEEWLKKKKAELVGDMPPVQTSLLKE
jgi:hypothetical protein